MQCACEMGSTNWRVMGGSHCSFFFPTSHIGLSRATARWLWRSCWTDLAILFVSMSISPDLSPEMSILRAAALVDCDLNSPISWSLRCAAHICCADPIVGSCLSWCTLLGPGRSSPHASLADMERIVRTRFRATADDRVIDEGTRVSRGGLGENAFEAVNGINWAWLCGGCICLRLLLQLKANPSNNDHSSHKFLRKRHRSMLHHNPLIYCKLHAYL